VLTKILKPAYATLQSQGFENVGYIDDSYLQGGTFADCDTNVAATTNLFGDLGFILNQEKDKTDNHFPGFCFEFSCQDCCRDTRQGYKISHKS